MNRRDAALHLARRYPGGLEALAPRMGKRGDTLRKELTGVEGYKWGVDDEELLIALCQAARVDDALAPITAAALTAGALLLPLPPDEQEDETPAQILASATRSFGGFMEAIGTTLSAGAISANQVKAIERQAAAVVLTAQRQVIAARAQLGQQTEGRPQA